MPIETDEVVLRNDGTAIRRVYTEHPCNVVDKIATVMGENAVRIVKNAAELDKLPYSLVASAKELYAVIRLPFLTLNCPWVIGSDKLMRPNFGDTSGESPTMPIKWPAPTGMTLVFAARIYQGSGLSESRAKDSCYLLALDKSFNCFLLPLPNLYDSGYLCMGQFDGVTHSVHGAFELAYRQFIQSKWNADLYSSERKAKVDKMMAFKPEGELFIPQDCPSWASLLQRCEGPSIELVKGALKP